MHVCMRELESSFLLDKFKVWVSNPRPAATFVKCVYHKGYNIIYAVRYTNYCYFSTCDPLTSPQ
jgi:hypothetical protein